MRRIIDLDNRLVVFAVSISDLAGKLPNNINGKYMAAQIIRSGNSCALNYGEAMAAESGPDFIHKMKVVLKELRETFMSLKIIHMKKMGDSTLSEKCLKECNELISIFVQSICTAQKNRNR